jgi:hypothetical protein
MKVAGWYRTVVADDPETDLLVHWSLKLLKKSMITAAAVLAIATGATALQSSTAEAGVTIQLVHGSGHGFGPGWGYWFGPRWRHHGYHHARRGPRFGRGSYYGQKIRRGARRPSVSLNFDNGRSSRNRGRNNNRR